MAATKKKASPTNQNQPPRSRGKGTSKKSIGPRSSISTLNKLARTKTKQFLHSEATTEKYDGYVKQAQEFLESFFAEENEAEAKWKAGKAGVGHRLSGDGEEEIDEDESLLNDPEFRNALNGCPVKCTPQVITMFLTWKCFGQNNKKSTADGAHAALIAQYDQL